MSSPPSEPAGGGTGVHSAAEARHQGEAADESVAATGSPATPRPAHGLHHPPPLVTHLEGADAAAVVSVGFASDDDGDEVGGVDDDDDVLSPVVVELPGAPLVDRLPLAARKTVTTVLVTRADAFVAAHVVRALLRCGFAVRGTVRSERDVERCAYLRGGGGPPSSGSLELVVADLCDEASCDAAVASCSHVIHAIGAGATADEPAGTLRLLRAAAAAGVRRCVLTSSTDSVCHGAARGNNYVYTEKDWTDPAKPQRARGRHAALLRAERAALRFASSGNPRGMGVAVLNPSAVLGPLLAPHHAGDAAAGDAAASVLAMLQGAVPGLPNAYLGVVDVRDVAAAHVLAMLRAAAAGRRFLLHAETVHVSSVAEQLAALYQPRGFWVPCVRLPRALLCALAVVDGGGDGGAALRGGEPGRRRLVSTARAEEVLGARFRPAAESVEATAASLVRAGAVQPSSWPRGRVALALGAVLCAAGVAGAGLLVAARI